MALLEATHAGAVTNYSEVIEVSLSVDTNAYIANDLLADAQEIPNFMRVQEGTAILTSVTVIDPDDQGAAFDLFFTPTSTTWGTENAAMGASDAIVSDIQQAISIAAGEYLDMIGSQMVTKSNLNMPLRATSGVSMYVAAVSRGTPTYAGGVITLQLGILRD